MSNKQYSIYESLETILVIDQELFKSQNFENFTEIYTYFKGYFVSSYIAKKLAESKCLKYEEIL